MFSFNTLIKTLKGFYIFRYGSISGTYIRQSWITELKRRITVLNHPQLQILTLSVSLDYIGEELFGPKLFRPKVYLIIVSSKRCLTRISFIYHNWQFKFLHFFI